MGTCPGALLGALFFSLLTIAAEVIFMPLGLYMAFTGAICGTYMALKGQEGE